MPYPQDDEERVIFEHVGHLPASCILDVGAHDGITFSNSRALIERGWRAVLAEPSPDAFLKLIELYGKEERVDLVNAFVVPDGQNGQIKKPVKFWHSPDMVSTGTFAHYETWRNTAHFDATFWVAPLPFNALLWVTQGDYAVISIDTEGSSPDFLNCALAANPRLLVIEHDHKHAQMTADASLLNDRYNCVYVGGTNMIFVRRE